jgi:hypothetical protein
MEQRPSDTVPKVINQIITMFHVYKLYDKKNSKVTAYVGLTTSIFQRRLTHLRGYDKATRKWVKAASKPTVKELTVAANKKDGRILENYWIMKLNPAINQQRYGREDSPRPVVLDKQATDALIAIKSKCEWPASFGVIASYAFRNGLAETRRVFNPKKK